MIVTFIFAVTGQTPRVDAMWDKVDATINRRLDQYWHAGLYEESVTILRILRGMRPTDAEVSGNLAWMLGNLNRKDEGLAEAKSFYRANPGDEIGRILLAQEYMSRKIYDKIIPVLEPLLANAIRIPIFSMLARAYEETGRLKEALNVWELRQKKYPNDVNTKNNIRRLKSIISKRLAPAPRRAQNEKTIYYCHRSREKEFLGIFERL